MYCFRQWGPRRAKVGRLRGDARGLVPATGQVPGAPCGVFTLEAVTSCPRVPAEDARAWEPGGDSPEGRPATQQQDGGHPLATLTQNGSQGTKADLTPPGEILAASGEPRPPTSQELGSLSGHVPPRVWPTSGLAHLTSQSPSYAKTPRRPAAPSPPLWDGSQGLPGGKALHQDRWAGLMKTNGGVRTHTQPTKGHGPHAKQPRGLSLFQGRDLVRGQGSGTFSQSRFESKRSPP